MNRDNKYYKWFQISASINIIIITFIISTSIASASDLKKSILDIPLYFNGEEISLSEGFIVDGRTYVQLKELCDNSNISVDWVDPNPDNNQALIPGGNLPGGINLTNPSFIYMKNVTDYNNTDQIIQAVEITGIYQKYKDTNTKLIYSFNDYGLVIRTNGTEKLIPLDYNPSSGRMYLEKEIFKDKVLPYLVEICEQE